MEIEDRKTSELLHVRGGRSCNETKANSDLEGKHP